MKVIRQILFLVWKDLRLFLRDRLALFFALAFPLIFVAGFSFALGNVGVQDKPVQVVFATEEGSGSLSRQLIDAIVADPARHARMMTPADARAQTNSGKLGGFILFPQGFSSAVESGQPARIRVVGDPNDSQTRAMLSGVASSIALDLTSRQVVATTSVGLAQYSTTPVDRHILMTTIQRMVGASAALPQPVSLNIEQVGNAPKIQAASVVLPGYITMFIFFAASFAAQQFLAERTNHTLDRLLASGVSGPTILAGKWLGTAARSVLQATVLWTAGVLLFHVNMGSSPLGAILVTLGFIAASASFGLFLAALAKTPRAASGLVALFALGLAALGGSWWPLFVMPQWMQQLARITPHAWANDAFNRLMLFGASTGDVLLDLAVLLGIALALGIAGAARLRVHA